MSAYLCSPEHIGALAHFAARNDSTVIEAWKHETKVMTMVNVAEKLAAANLASIEARYPDCLERGFYPGPVFEGVTDLEAYRLVYLNQCRQWAEYYFRHSPPLQPLDYWAMASGFDYQACEVSDWTGSDAWRQIEWIKDGAVRQLPGFGDSVRDWIDDQTKVAAPGGGAHRPVAR